MFLNPTVMHVPSCGIHIIRRSLRALGSAACVLSTFRQVNQMRIIKLLIVVQIARADWAKPLLLSGDFNVRRAHSTYYAYAGYLVWICVMALSG